LAPPDRRYPFLISKGYHVIHSLAARIEERLSQQVETLNNGIPVSFVSIRFGGGEPYEAHGNVLRRH